MNYRERAAEVYKSLREARSADAALAVELVRLLYDEAKEDLVKATEADMMRSQGKAQLLKKMYQELTTRPPHIGQE